MTASCKNAPSSDSGASRQLTFPALRAYSDDTQEKLRQELVAVGCIPSEKILTGCTMPTVYAMLVDYYKMREQDRIAMDAWRATHK